ncbi:hypothetical protein [Hymenobacter metallicola]|uniref:Uncharacterized protein n=1 Tax=Hymenobacter metallicola TaxID=2563114 RepID=A0A4Z0QJF9_9BACT|nr:hypothetical protein [Hymenobacter metallicola]TGE29835.1 hypothetical protein E5K02_10350 [Hymenobacter metallicola]
MKDNTALTGAELIAAERQEQIHKHGWDVAHDDDYGRGELMQAAATALSLYASGDMANICVAGQTEEVKMWPWQTEFGLVFFRKIERKSPLEKLIVAGALIAAEIDRLQRATNCTEGCRNASGNPSCPGCCIPTDK